jgi:hypothetical protein
MNSPEAAAVHAGARWHRHRRPVVAGGPLQPRDGADRGVVRVRRAARQDAVERPRHAHPPRLAARSPQQLLLWHPGDRHQGFLPLLISTLTMKVLWHLDLEEHRAPARRRLAASAGRVLASRRRRPREVLVGVCRRQLHLHSAIGLTPQTRLLVPVVPLLLVWYEQEQHVVRTLLASLNSDVVRRNEY